MEMEMDIKANDSSGFLFLKGGAGGTENFVETLMG